MTLGEVSLDADIEPPDVAPAGATAILILVDTSDPARSDAVSQARIHVQKLIGAGESHHHFGIARFDSELEMLASIGSDADALARATAGLTAVGKTTELYRNALAAVRLLATYPAERRALYLLSDGLAEDQAYYHDDVVEAAIEAGVIINGLGYPRSVALSVGLQSLRRLADETGGKYLATDAGFTLPAAFFESPFSAIDTVGNLRIDLTRLEEAASAGLEPALRVVVHTSAGTAQATVPVIRPPAAEPEPVVKVIEIEVPKVIEVPTVIEVPVIEAPAAPRGSELGLSGVSPWIAWTAVGIIGLVLVLLLVILVLLVLRRRRGREAEGGSGAAEDVRSKPRITLAFLEPVDGSGERHAVTSVAFRIGRHGDNDLILVDPSVSRHHAEIHRRRDGTFTVTDLESMNGVFVNGKRERAAKLADADLLEIGDVGLTFSTKLSEDIGGEETVMLRTVVPINSLEDTLADDDGQKLAYQHIETSTKG